MLFTHTSIKSENRAKLLKVSFLRLLIFAKLARTLAKADREQARARVAFNPLYEGKSKFRFLVSHSCDGCNLGPLGLEVSPRGLVIAPSLSPRYSLPMPEEIRELAKSPAPGRYTGQRIARLRPRAYRKAIGLLASGASVNAVCEACTMDFRSVVAIREAEAASITERKNSLSSLAYRIASGAGETIENDIAAGKLHGSAAVVAFGVATDKLLALSDQPTARPRAGRVRLGQPRRAVPSRHRVHPPRRRSPGSPGSPGPIRSPASRSPTPGPIRLRFHASRSRRSRAPVPGPLCAPLTCALCVLCVLLLVNGHKGQVLRAQKVTSITSDNGSKIKSGRNALAFNINQRP